MPPFLARHYGWKRILTIGETEMIDALFAQIRAFADSWTGEASHRREISAIDPVADTLDHCASRLRGYVAELDQGLAYVSPEEYGAAHGVTPQTVRKWIRDGELEAVMTEGGAYKIRRDARRRKTL